MKIFYKPSAYTKEATGKALQAAFHEYELVEEPSHAQLQWADYEELDFQAALDNSQCWICAYSIRKALIRKHFLSQTVREYVAKHETSILRSGIPETWNLEVDFVEFLDDALDESFELRCELEANEILPEAERKWFILKPGMAERGAGLRLFSTIEELTSIFVDNEPQDDDDEKLTIEADGPLSKPQHMIENNHGVMTSDMRFFVVQEYLAQPLLLKSLQFRKFHIRAYVCCIGSLQVFVHKNMLVLSSSEPYSSPSFDTEALSKHLTNSCYQEAVTKSSSTQNVNDFWQFTDENLDKQRIWQQVKDITGQTFDAACSQRVNFQTLPNAFEIFGIDYLVSEQLNVSLLEVNAYPDFAQTGQQLKPLVDEVITDMVGLVAMAMIQSKTSRNAQSLLDTYGKFCRCLLKRLFS